MSQDITFSQESPKYKPISIFTILNKGEAYKNKFQYFTNIINEPNFNPNIQTQSITPLMIAVREGPNFVQALLDKGADPNIKDRDGTTALMRAIYLYVHISEITDNILPILLSPKTNINEQDNEGNTALAYAARNVNYSDEGLGVKIFKLLLKYGADPHIKNNQGESVVLAYNPNVFKIIKPLLDIPLEEKIFEIDPVTQDKITVKMIKETMMKEQSELFSEYFKRVNKSITEKQKLLFSEKLYENAYTIINNYKDILNKVLEYEKMKPDFETLQEESGGLVIKLSLRSGESQEDFRYIIKITHSNEPSSKEDNFDEHLNEAFVGLIGGLNDLTIPNFAKIYGITTANKCPNIIKMKDKDCTFVIYEYIPGKNIEDWYAHYNSIKSTRIVPVILSGIKNILLQIFYSLYEANKKLGFTHYDLHTKNIIIAPIDKTLTVNYLAGELILDFYKVTFIDYGSSHIVFKEKDYGRTYVGGIRNTTWWVHDIFKILMYLYKQQKNIEIKNLLISLLKFFTNEYDAILLLPHNANWFGIERFNFTKTFDDFLKHARDILK